MKPLERLTLLACVVILGLLLTCCGGFAFVEIPFLLAFGWIPFLIHTVPQMTTEPLALAVGGTALVCFTTLAHGLLRWLYGHLSHESSPAPRWRFRWTLAGVGGLLLMTMATIAVMVSVHQLGWLAHSQEPWFASSSEAVYRYQSLNNLKQIGLAVGNYESQHHAYPSGGTFNQFGEPMHSWETALLPFLEATDVSIDPNVPWKHPTNAPQFRKPLYLMLNPSFQDAKTDAEGFALSHYAANGRVLGAGRSLRAEEVTDGLSQTILAGEVSQNFRAWGDPINWRDPALGLNTSPESFGGPPRFGGTNVIFLDGSVQFLNQKTDPAVLRALSTPAGGEPLNREEIP